MKTLSRLKIRRICAVIGFLGLSCAVQAGTQIVYTDGARSLFEIEVPDFWAVRTGGVRDLAGPDSGDVRDVSRVFGMTPDAHAGIWVGVISPHGVSTLKEARDYLRDIGPFLVQDAEVSATKPRRIGGLRASSVAGKGRRDGKSIDFTVLAIDLPGNRVAIAVVVFEAGADMTPLEDINKMLASIKSVGGL